MFLFVVTWADSGAVAELLSTTVPLPAHFSIRPSSASICIAFRRVLRLTSYCDASVCSVGSRLPTGYAPLWMPSLMSSYIMEYRNFSLLISVLSSVI